MVENTTRYLASDVQVHIKGYHDDPSLDLAMSEAAPVAQAVARDPDVAASTVRLEGKVLASRGDKARGILMIGVSPPGRSARHFSVRRNRGRCAASINRFDRRADRRQTRRRARPRASVTSWCSLDRRTTARSRARACRCAESFARTSIEYDGYVAVMPLGAVREFLAAPNGATSIALRLKDRDRLDVVAPRLQAGLRRSATRWSVGPRCFPRW